MNGWYWFLICGAGVAIFSHLLFPAKRGIGITYGILTACTGALLGGYLTARLGNFPANHWLPLLVACFNGALFFWMIRLFSPRRYL
ncbi:MAG: hypothetical protein NUV70_02275 [Caldiserica bacterium]|jgi:uncharacterized membrane protein YeaQ/YmgE (transglycosylase-associated protein family)|nr:hypothetical protein [Caldisericota bacterium]